MAIPLGQINFRVVTINYANFARALQSFLAYGSRKGHIEISDLCIVSDQTPIPTRFTDVEEAIKHGTKFFDACMYFSLPEGDRPQISPMTNDTVPDSRTFGSIGEAVFVIYFYLLTRARPPARTGDDAAHPTPRFLEGVLSLTKGNPYYLDLASGFDVSKMDHKWIEDVDIGTLGDEFKNRAGLGVAGYRMFGPYKSYQPKPGLPQNLLNAVQVAHRIATSPPDWDIHPVTRNPELLSRMGNINQNLGNLILDVFTEENIREMVKTKMIFRKPEFQPNHIQYRTWTLDRLIPLNKPIFRVRTG